MLLAVTATFNFFDCNEVASWSELTLVACAILIQDVQQADEFERCDFLKDGNNRIIQDNRFISCRWQYQKRSWLRLSSVMRPGIHPTPDPQAVPGRISSSLFPQ